METELIPSDPTVVSAAWMQQALTGAGLTGGATVQSVEFGGFIGTGQMARNARYRLTWDDPTGRPATLVAKCPSDDPTGRHSGFTNGSYRREWTFYREVVHTVRVRAPHCHVARFDDAGENFILLMEDMAGSAQGDQFRGLTPDEAALAVEQAVALHGPRWGDLSLASLANRTQEEAVTLMHDRYAAMAEPALARLAAWIDESVVALVHALAPKVGAWITASDTAPTLTHMDFRPDNFLFGVSPDAPPLTVVDWQTVTLGQGANDLAYMIGGSFEPDDRTSVETALLREYCERMQADHGLVYGFDTCWRDYRIGSLWGVIMSIIATVLAAQTERGDRMLATMLRRHASHAIAVDALELVG